MSLLRSLLPLTVLAGCAPQMPSPQERQTELSTAIKSEGGLSSSELTSYIGRNSLTLDRYKEDVRTLDVSQNRGPLNMARFDCANGDHHFACVDRRGRDFTALYDTQAGSIIRTADDYETTEANGYLWEVNGQYILRGQYSLIKYSDPSSTQNLGEVVISKLLAKPEVVLRSSEATIWQGVTQYSSGYDDKLHDSLRTFTTALFTTGGFIAGSQMTYSVLGHDNNTSNPDLYKLTIADILGQPAFPPQFIAAIQKYQTDNDLPSTADIIVVRKPHSVPSFGSQMDANWTSSGIFTRTGSSTAISSTVTNNNQSAWYGALSPSGKWIATTWPDSLNEPPVVASSAE